MLLAVETSGGVGSVALLDQGGCRWSRSLQLGGRHGQTLLPEIERLLRDSGLTPTQLTAIAVGLGPGSYTGLRIGVVCAKSLAFALRCPLVGVETFRCIAVASLADPPLASGTRPGRVETNRPPEDPTPPRTQTSEPPSIWVVADALRGRLFTGRYSIARREQLAALEPLAVREQADWLARLQPGDLVSGPGADLVRESLPEGVDLAPPATWLPQAAEVGALAMLDLGRGVSHDPATLAPLYLRESSAETQWDKLHGGRK
ncbi:MAG: tRNA (adenosine(37)-N6)-threonylcarbamoyltransferase complex dimerization subunit type 1 TsaB [Planctomycetaceae bacterium]